MSNRPSGTVTFLFSDIEPSPHYSELPPERPPAAVARYNSLLREGIERLGGFVFKAAGDHFCAAFATAPAALLTALAVRQAIYATTWDEDRPPGIRMALHTGIAEERDGDYFGPPLNRVARLLAAGHGGQVLLSLVTAELVRAHLPTGAHLLDLGEHRLPDLIQPEHIFQLVSREGPADFPPLRTLDVHPHNLPAQLTELIGRESLVQAAATLLRRSDIRLLTFTGAGGIGKTRLALQTAAELIHEFVHGVFFVNLAPISDPGLVYETLAETLEIREGSGQPLVPSLLNFLRDKQILLILDNFEQVLAAAPLVTNLLTVAPRVKLLITSRIGLHVSGEHEFAVPPLSLPATIQATPIEQLLQYEAIRLFVDRAQAVKHDFVLTPENAAAVLGICRRLDGLALAIELAAARTKILSPAALLTRLSHRLHLLTGGGQDRPARHQTLRNTLEWSYGLLPPAEQALFRRLAVFPSGFTLEAAAAVCNGAADLGVDVLDGIESVVANSLLQQGDSPEDDPRFVMLETIHEYADERLADSDETATMQQAHAGFFLDLAEAAEPWLTSAKRNNWLARLEQEHDNFRAALAWSRRAPETSEIGLRMAGALVWFWYFRGYLSEGRRWLESVLAADGATGSAAAQAKALGAAGALAFLQSDYAHARVRLEASLRLWRELGIARGVAYALMFLSQVAARQGDPAARALGEESLTLFRQVNDPWGHALALDFFGEVARASGDESQRSALHAQSLALFRELGDHWGVALELGSFGRVAWQHGDYATARRQLQEALGVQRAVGDKWNVAWLLRSLGDVARYEGDYTQARMLLEESLALFRSLADQWGINNTLYLLGLVAQQRQDLSQATVLLRESLSLARETGDQWVSVQCLITLAAIAVATGDAERGGVLGGAAEDLFADAGTYLEPAERAEAARHLATLRSRPVGPSFTAGWAQGRALPLTHAIALALQDMPIPVDRPEAAGPIGKPAPAPASTMRPDPDALTPREIEVLRLVAAGMTDAAIARQLVLSPRTVQVHLRSIYSKLNITTRSSATRYALEQHLA
jgi:predicted ATPase/class 3 adenylate cyclase/DNA-binding CsgD family transcriptional regulator